MVKLNFWLTKQESVRLVPILDKAIVFFVKVIYLLSYLILRLSLRIALGKNRRDRLFVAKRRLAFDYNFDPNPVPSFYIIKFIYSIIRFLGFASSPSLLKITVPKHGGYKAYCPINKDDFINMTIREDDIIEHFTPKEGDVVVDVGAHIGLYTIIASKRVGINGKVVSIEADPGNFEMLNRNIKLNKLSNIIPLNYAAYSKETKIKLYLPEVESGYTIYNTIMSNRARLQDKFVEVNANTLDNLLQLNEIREVNWIKIDVEGAEFEVLKGAHNVLSKNKDIALLIEVHGLDNYRQVLEFLRSYNFKIEFEKSNKVGDWRHIVLRKVDQHYHLDS